MKQTKGYQIWQIIYPIGIYYVVSSLCYFALEMLLGNADETYMLRQLVCAAVTIPAILKYYMADKNIQTSDGFPTANQAFFAGTAVYELLGSCFLIPIAEELLFRGVVYQRLKLMLGVSPAIICSALIFGLVHVNLVQFLYAAVLGCLLAYLYEKTGFFYVPVLGHIAANTAAVVRAETGWLSFGYTADAKVIGFTVVMLVVAGTAVWSFWKWKKNVGVDERA